MTENKIENKLYVDGKEVTYTDERNLLEVIRKAGIEVPTFCYRPDLTLYGACRMCVVEIEGRGIQASCTMPPEPGLKVRVNTEKTRRVRKVSLELLLASHDRECTTCERCNSCELQDLSNKYNVRDVRFGKKEEMMPVDTSNPSVTRDPNKCILCGACVRACKEIQGHGVLDFANRGSKTVVTPAFNKDMADVDCVYCGQCIAVCPTAALTIKSDIERAWKSILDEKKTVVAQVAPAVRVAVGEAFDLPSGQDTIGLITAALRKIGFDKVFDTSFSADMTIMEEATEFVSRLTKNKNLPLFTSCCPAWVRYAEQKYPEYLNNLSTCRSPQQIFGSLMKTYLPKEYGIDVEDLVVISIMPCTAKKAEAEREEFSKDSNQDVDMVLTSQEIIKMIKEAGIDLKSLEPEQMDAPFGIFTGAGVIFGSSGGVAEAAVRTAYEMVTGKKLEKFTITEARGLDTLKELEIDIEGTKVRMAIVNTLGETEKLIERVKNGEVQYDMIEVMACPGGCVGGGGQPSSCKNRQIKVDRSKGLYKADVLMHINKSHENPDVQKLYEQWLEKPNSKIAHDLLHTHYHNRRRITGEIEVNKTKNSNSTEVAVCVGTCCFLKGSVDLMESLTNEVKANNLEDKVQVKGTFCFENCGVGPNIAVNGELVSESTPDKAKEIFQNYIAKKVK